MLHLIELAICLSTILPLFHLFNALFALLLKKRKRDGAKPTEKMFSILIPCYNEQDTIEASLSGLLALQYNKFEAIYINDGSSDRTLRKLKKRLRCRQSTVPILTGLGIKSIYQSERHRNIIVVDKERGGKSAALNVGLLLARAKLVVTLDADSILKADALQHVNRAFSDEKVIAACGSIHISQGYSGELTRQFSLIERTLVLQQILEYLKGFYVYKPSLARQKAIAILSGAFSIFKKEVVLALGGYRDTLGEDVDITMRLQQMICKSKLSILYLPEAVCYTQCPENLRDLKKQRIRWQKGFVDCALHQSWFLLRTFLVRSVSFHFFMEAIGVALCSGLFTVFSYLFALAIILWGNGEQIGNIVWAYFGFCLLFGMINDIAAIVLSRRYNRYPAVVMRKLVPAILIDILLYRYFTLGMYLGGTISYFWRRERQDGWNKFARSKKQTVVISG